MGQRAARDEINTQIDVGLHVVTRDVARAFRKRTIANELDRARHGVVVHVVKHDDVGTRLEPPPKRTASFSKMRMPGVVLRVSTSVVLLPSSRSAIWRVYVAMPLMRCK